MIKSPKDYKWSCYAGNALGNKDLLISQHMLYRALGRTKYLRQSAYRSLFDSAIPNAVLDVIRESTNKGWALGGTKFCERIEVLSKRRSKPAEIGRPKGAKN
jgi:putative transposase